MLILPIESRLDMARIRAETPGVWKSVFLSASGTALMPEPVIEAVVNHTMLEANLGGYEAQAKHLQSLSRFMIWSQVTSMQNQMKLRSWRTRLLLGRMHFMLFL